jgi:hypothetical protein
LGSIAQFGEFHLNKPNTFSIAPFEKVYAVFTGKVGTLAQSTAAGAVCIGCAGYKGADTTDESVHIILRTWIDDDTIPETE